MNFLQKGLKLVVCKVHIYIGHLLLRFRRLQCVMLCRILSPAWLLAVEVVELCCFDLVLVG
jgi:hypothetical protein